jgi:hypothetical protein
MGKKKQRDNHRFVARLFQPQPQVRHEHETEFVQQITTACFCFAVFSEPHACDERNDQL